ncbi:MAG TPA: hypothetical protein VFC41_01795 [Anaerovoracaceae bacterium]|nr:hypothetical protein [Anaerovoracaceae bacterium]
MMEYIIFKCSECGTLVAYPSWTSDGRRCSECKGFIINKNKGTKHELIEMYGDRIIFNGKHTPVE